MSPEMFEGNYDEKCDIWSAGVILYSMITGNIPFNGTDMVKLKAAIREAYIDYTRPVWGTVSVDIQDLLKHMIDPDPKTRFSAEQVLNHKWFQAYKSGSLSNSPISDEAFANLTKFHATDKLHKFILMFISSCIMDEESNKELVKLFKSIDKNNDGRLSFDEVINGYKELGLPLTQADEIIKKVDFDQSGMIEYSEFITAAQDWKLACQKDLLEKTFNTYDVGGDGYLSLYELKALIPNIENSEWQKFFNDADKDKDGVISLAEFKDYMLSFKQ
jgi:calcium-dependent protein kinase